MAPERLLKANAAFEASSITVKIVGPALAAGIIAATGTGTVFLIDAATFIFSALVIYHLRHPSLEKVAASPEYRGAASLAHEILTGMHFLASSRVLIVLVWTISAVMFSLGALNVVMPVYLRECIGLEEESLGMVMSVEAIGALLGCVMAARMGRWASTSSTACGSIFISGLALAGLFVTGRPGGVLSCVAVTGFGLATASTIIETMLMTATHDAVRGRVLSNFTAITTAAYALAGLGAMSATVIGARGVIGVSAAVMATAGSIAWRELRFRQHIQPMFVSRS